jgi:uncharacterized protein YndB with AHSA1/START domain
MHKRRFLLGWVEFALLLVSLPVLAAGDWEVVENENGCKVENRVFPGSVMKEFRAETIIDAPLEVVFEVQMDSNGMSQWFGDCVEQKVLKRLSQNKKMIYHVVHAPWPVQDRDAIAVVETTPDWERGKVVQEVRSIRPPADREYGMDETTEKNNRVRMPKMDATFTLTRISPERTKYSYWAHAEPGIALPASMLNMYAKKQPYKTLINIKEQVKKPIYWQRANSAHKKEFKPLSGK